MTPGSLFVIATPIGNLEDITYRAVSTLKNVDYIVCEDTRVSRKLLNKYDINSNLISCNEHNELKKINSIKKILLDGNDVALICDAGTPTISDPGYRIISDIRKENSNISIYSIPGACAAISSLSISGLPPDKFTFIGFLPKKKGRNKKINDLKNLSGSLIIYESPHRVYKTLEDIYNALGNRIVFIAREMTKLYEESFYLDLKTIFEREVILMDKGEYVIVIAKEGYGFE